MPEQEYIYGNFPNGLSVGIPVDKRKNKVYRISAKELTEEEAIDLAQTILIVAGAREEPKPVPPGKKPTKPVKDASGVVFGAEGMPSICSSCKSVPCTFVDKRGTTPIIECPNYTGGG